MDETIADAYEQDRLQALFDLADDIIDAGFDVFPAAVWLHDDGTVGKAPLTRHGHLEATDSRQVARQWLAAPPHVPLSVPALHDVVVAFVPGSGGCGVLDCDVKHGKAGKAALADLQRQYGGEWITAAWQSPSGGVNILFRKQSGRSLGNRSPWPGIDVRADNGWVVAPGNVCDAGAWRWKVGGYRSAHDLPGAMDDLLTESTERHAQAASNSETVAFIEASPLDSSYDAQRAFGEQLTAFRSSAPGSRHDAMLRIVSWCCGMHALDLRYAEEQIKAEWLDLTAGEGREDEVTEVLTWVVGQELAKRAAAEAVVEPEPESIDAYQDDDLPAPIDWAAFAQRDSAVKDWLIDQFWPKGRSLALWADAKAGKSELALWCAASLAMGKHPWTGSPVPPLDVIYLDYEMTEDDLEERLDSFGVDLDDLGHLHYYLLPLLAPLNDERGGAQLLRLVERHQAAVVVIDTFGRALAGEEDKADTVNDFYRITGKPLKRAGVSYLRTDHAGKDRAKGQRGTSAKRADVDVIWQQRRMASGAILNCEGSSRLNWVPSKLALTRTVTGGIITYGLPLSMVGGGWPAGTAAKAAELDAAGVPLDVGRPAARKALKKAKIVPGTNEVLAAALKFRRNPGYMADEPVSLPSADLDSGQPDSSRADLGDALFTPDEQEERDADN